MNLVLNFKFDCTNLTFQIFHFFVRKLVNLPYNLHVILLNISGCFIHLNDNPV